MYGFIVIEIMVTHYYILLIGMGQLVLMYMAHHYELDCAVFVSSVTLIIYLT